MSTETVPMLEEDGQDMEDLTEEDGQDNRRISQWTGLTFEETLKKFDDVQKCYARNMAEDGMKRRFAQLKPNEDQMIRVDVYAYRQFYGHIDDSEFEANLKNFDKFFYWQQDGMVTYEYYMWLSENWVWEVCRNYTSDWNFVEPFVTKITEEPVDTTVIDEPVATIAAEESVVIDNESEEIDVLDTVDSDEAI